MEGKIYYSAIDSWRSLEIKVSFCGRVLVSMKAEAMEKFMTLAIGMVLID